MQDKKVYRNWDHYWSNGNHGFSSASKDYAKEIWDDFQPTIEASLDDYKRAYIKLTEEQLKFRSELTDALLDYIELYKKEDAPKFWKWFLEQSRKETLDKPE
jgi:hypothetical protein